MVTECYEVWKSASGNSIASFASSNAAARAQLESDAKLLFTVSAGSYEAAMVEINRRLGLEPYKPVSEN